MVAHKFCETAGGEGRGKGEERGEEKERKKIVRVNLCMDRWIFLKHFLSHQGISIAF